MASIDYGSLLRINGKFINKNTDPYQDMRESLGFALTKVTDDEGNEYRINDNYFVYAGDKELFAAFYKNFITIISNDKLVQTKWAHDFDREAVYINDVHFNIERIDKNVRTEKRPRTDYFHEFTKNQKRQYLSRMARMNRGYGVYRYKSSRFLASWEYKGNKYEVIFGYGVDNNKEVWDDIKNMPWAKCSYQFSDVERELIDSWFDGCA